MLPFEDRVQSGQSFRVRPGDDSSKDHSHEPTSPFSRLSSSRKSPASGSGRGGNSATNQLFRYRVAPSAGFDYVSDAMVHATGFPARLFYANPNLLSQLTIPGDRTALVSILNASWPAVNPVQVHLRGTRRTTLLVELTRRQIHNEDGEIVAIEVVGHRVNGATSGDDEDWETDPGLEATIELCNEALGVLQPVRSDDGDVADFNWIVVNEELEAALDFPMGTLAGSKLSQSLGPVAGSLIRFLVDRMFAPETPARIHSFDLARGQTLRVAIRGETIIVNVERRQLSSSTLIETIENRIDATLDLDRPLEDRLSILCDALIELGTDFSTVLLRPVTSGEPVAVLRTSPDFAGRPVMAESISHWLGHSIASPDSLDRRDPDFEFDVVIPADERSHESSGSDLVIAAIQHTEPSSLHVTPLRGANDELGMILFGTARESLPLDESRIRIAQLLIRPLTFLIENHELRDEVRSTTQVREEFMSLVAHEIKTPLTGIRGYGQLLERFLARDEPDLIRTRRAVSGLQTQIERFGVLASDLLDATRIRQGRLELRLEPSSLQAIVESAVERVQALEPATDRHILVNIEGPIVGVWDAARIDQVLYILLSNAVTYSVDGDIRLIARREGDAATISVSDEGSGIGEEDIKLLFEPFASGSRTHRPINGSGLGLYLAREILRRHGGQISLRSQEQTGTTFTIRLPLNSQEVASRADPTD